jgi:AraC-like DNA-binding protein
MARPTVEFRSPWFGRERLDARRSIARHRHQHGYIAVVLSGSYQEAGLDGRRNLTAGHVVVHHPFDAHLDHVGLAGAEVLNLPLPECSSLPTAFFIDDPDAVARLAETDPVGAVTLLQPAGEVCAGSDWADRLAAALVQNSDQRLADWAGEAGLAPETLSRGFRAAYGVTPARFRIEARARRAMTMIERGDAGLAAVAADSGFADQSHLTRIIFELTGQTPGNWRRSISFKRRVAISA